MDTADVICFFCDARAGLTADDAEVADYLREVETQSIVRFEAGMGPEEATLDLAASGGLARYAGWRDAERIAVNVDTAWRHWSGSTQAPDALALFGRMARLYFDRR